jgi:hypothetical protein
MLRTRQVLGFAWRSVHLGLSTSALVILLSLAALAAENCLTATDMDAATRSGLESTAKSYFDMAVRGDVASLRQSSTTALASNFGGIEAAVNDNKERFTGVQTTVRPPYLLEERGNTPAERANFYCGIYNSPDRVGFAIPNLAPGNYGVVTLEVKTTKDGAYSVSMVLQQEGSASAATTAAATPSGSWKLAGYYVRPQTISGHDAQWFLDQARAFKAKGQVHNAYFYYLQARQLMSPVDFMGTPQLDKLYDETQQVIPKDLPVGGPVDQVLGGKNYKLAQVFPVPVGNDLDLVVKYQVPDISDTNQTFQDNMTVIKGIVAKYPELRDAFAAVVARAVNPAGQDYGSLLPMSQIK